MLETLGTRVEVPVAPDPAATDPGGRRRRTRAPGASSRTPARRRDAAIYRRHVGVRAPDFRPARFAADRCRAREGAGHRHTRPPGPAPGLRLAARLVASFPELKALFETDTATIRDYLLAYQQRNPGTGILLAFDPAGEALAQTDQTTPSAEKMSLQALLDAPNAMSIVTLAGKPHHAAAAESEARGTVFGHVVAAAPVDAAFARALGEATQDDVVLLARDQALATTLRIGQAPWTSLAQWRAQGGRTDATVRIDVGGQRVAAREVLLQRDPPVSAVLLKSDEHALEPYRRMQRGIVLIGLAAIVLTIAGSVWFASNRGQRA